MKKYLTAILLILSAAIFSSCTSMSNDIKVIPTQGLRLVPIDFTVIGDTTAEESRTEMFMVDWAHLFNDQGARHVSEETSAPFFESLELKAKRAALYKALQKVPQADRLIEPRWTVKVQNMILMKTVTVTVTAKAIAFTRSSPDSK